MKGLVRIIAVSVLMLFVTSNLVYAGQFGPPEPAAKEGHVSIGTGYFYHSAKVKVTPEGGDEFEDKAKQNRVYLQVGYGFVKNGEIYLRVGSADFKIPEVFVEEDISWRPPDFKGDFKPFGTIGIKGFFDLSPSFGIGPFFQASLYSTYKDERGISVPEAGVTITETMRVKNLREVNLGVGLQGKIGGAILYAGPVAYWTKAKGDWTQTIIDDGFEETESASFKVKEKNNFGGFAGLRLPLTKNLNFEVEGQLKSKFSMGGALTYSF